MSNKFCEKHDSYVKNRFYAKVLLPNENGCMLWTASKRSFGYGAFSLFKGKAIRAHRYSYELFVGEIPKGKHILHRCDIPACVSPDHLYIGDNKQNAKDRIDRGRDSKPPVLCGEKNNKSKLTNEKVIEIIKLISDGLSDYAIAKTYQVDKKIILLIKQEKIWKEITTGKIKLANRPYKLKIKLNINQVQQIKEMIRIKIAPKSIAEKFNVSYGHIMNIKHGRRYKDGQK